MSESSNTLFVTVLGKADALGDLTTTNAMTNTFAGAGLAVGFAAAAAVAEGTTAAAPYTDAISDGLYNQFADQPYVDGLSLWGDAGLSIGLHDVRRDARCRRFFVWLLIVWAGESFRSWTFMIKSRPFISTSLSAL